MPKGIDKKIKFHVFGLIEFTAYLFFQKLKVNLFFQKTYTRVCKPKIAVLSENVTEIRFLVNNKDINLATRRLMDLAIDADFPQAIQLEIRDIRMKYNLKNELASDTQYLDAIHTLLDKMAVLIAERPKAMTFDDAKEIFLQGDDYLLYQPSENVKLGQLVFRGEHINKTYKGFPFSLKNITIELKTGEITGIVGENGNGKTTLLRVVAGELRSDNGKQIYPFLPENTDWYDIKKHIAFIPQFLEKWEGKLKDNLHFVASLHGIYGAENEDAVDFIIHRLGLSKYRNATWADISSGYKLRFALAKALVWRPKILILDEPLANLDINAKLLFMQDIKLLANSTRYPVSVIMSSQQLHEIENIVDRIMFLKNGVCQYYGLTDDFGVVRNNNVFEISGVFAMMELTNILTTLSSEIRLENTGQSFIVETPMSITSNQLLGFLIQHFKIDYFRDISQSTRKLFHQNA